MDPDTPDLVAIPIDTNRANTNNISKNNDSNHDFDEESHFKLWESYNTLSKRDKMVFIVSSLSILVFFILAIAGSIIALTNKDDNIPLRNAGLVIFSVFAFAFFASIVPYLVYGLKHLDNLENEKYNGETLEVL
jgi:hypothetical protein